MAANKSLFFKLKTAPYFLSVIYYYINTLFETAYIKFNEYTAEQVVHRYVKNETLRKVLLGQFPDYGLLPKDASFFIHASIVNHYLEGGYYPKGGPSVIAKSLIKKIHKFGGQVLVSEKVRNIIIENKIESAKQTLNFSLRQLNEKQKQFDTIQTKLSKFKDSTHHVNSIRELVNRLEAVPPLK